LSARALRELFAALTAFTLGNGAMWLGNAALRAAHGLGIQHPLGGLFEMWSGGPGGWWILVGLLAIAWSYPVRALLARRREDDATPERAGDLRILATLGAASSVGFVLFALVMVDAARRTQPAPNAKVDLSNLIRRAGESAGWTLVGSGLLVLVALWSAAVVLDARREPREAAAKIPWVVALASIASVTGIALLRFDGELSATFTTEWSPPLARYRNLVEAGAPLNQGRSALLVAAGIAAAMILILARRERQRPAPARSLIASAGLFALGLAAFAITRGTAHDAQAPLPFLDGAVSIEPELGGYAITELPPGQRCTPGVPEHPTLEVTHRGPHGRLARVGGGEVVRIGELPGALESHKQLWTQVNPGKQFPGHLEAMIPAEAPMDEVAPLLAAARAAGYVDFDVIEMMPQQTYVTRTRGEIIYRPRLCHVPIKSGLELPRQGTWGDFARSLDAP
jgi:hypothetical protein